jgi:transcriptional regulator with XRE-family HTH domain
MSDYASTNATRIGRSTEGKDRRAELANFLKAKRAQMTPEEAGLPNGVRRRTSGLRREEVAQLASVGLTWYTWLEQGRNISVSPQVLKGISRALQLSAAEQKYLFTLALPASMGIIDIEQSASLPDPNLKCILASLDNTLGFIMDQHWNIVAQNEAMEKVYCDFSALPAADRNLVRFMLTSPLCTERVANWEEVAKNTLAIFRADIVHFIGKQWLTELIADLTVVSASFRKWWSDPDIQIMYNAPKLLVHPITGEMWLDTTIFNAQGSLSPYRLVTVTPSTPESADRLAAFLHTNPCDKLSMKAKPLKMR